jgi:predicted RNA-binding protein with PIN domain
MSDMLFLVDGYNVTHRDAATSALSILEQREALVARLRVRGRDLLGDGRIVVVFDGEGGLGLSTGGGVPVEIVYAHKHSADDEIVRIASRAKGPVVVVSSDRELGRRAAERATVSVGVREASTCFEAARGKARPKSRGTIARDAGLPRGANAITRELKDLGLTDEDD